MNLAWGYRVPGACGHLYRDRDVNSTALDLEVLSISVEIWAMRIHEFKKTAQVCKDWKEKHDRNQVVGNNRKGGILEANKS